MNIAHLLPYSAKFPLEKHNGRYEWVLRLARAQAAKGHHVTIYAAPGSADSNNQINWSTIDQPTDDRAVNNAALMEAAFMDSSHDIFHSHFDFLHYLHAAKTNKPVIFTQHWFPNEQIADAARSYMGSNIFPIAPTHYMRDHDEKLGITGARVIHHGIDLELFRPKTRQKSDRLIFVGRITPGKGVAEAVRIALANNKCIDIVGKINDKDRDYWNSIEKHVDGKVVTYLGAKPQEEVAKLMAKASALLFPSVQREAFGQTIVEAQACGTPVISSDVGAASELIKHGETGFIASSEEDYSSAFENISHIRPADCRRFAELFDFHAMVNDYENLYLSVASKSEL